MSSALMLAAAPIRWADPATWPWVVWAWLAMFLVGLAQPLWRRLQRQRAQGWPTVQARIELVDVKKKPLLIARLFRGGRLLYTGELAYSYVLEGRYYPGHYQREFGSEEEGWEFVRSLQGRSVAVSYNARNPATSLLLEGAVNALLTSRPPLAEGRLQVPVSELPGWVTPLLWPFIALSAIGLALSLWVHLGAVAGRRVAPEAFSWMLFFIIFVVWMPAWLVFIERMSTTRKDYWNVALRGAPEWMRYMMDCILGYSMLNLAVFIFPAPHGGSGANPPVVVLRYLSGCWMVLCSVALAILYSAAAKDQS